MRENRDVAETLKKTSMCLKDDYIKNMSMLSKERTKYKNLIIRTKQKIDQAVDLAIKKARQELECEKKSIVEKWEFRFKLLLLYAVIASLSIVLMY